MKRKPSIVKIAEYARDILGQETFTSADLFTIGPEAAAYHTAMIPREVHQRKREILAKYGFTEETWCEVLNASGTFYFSPSEAAQKCNAEVRALFKTVEHIASVPYQDNYARACVNRAVRYGYFVIVKRNPKGFTYRLAAK